MALARADSKTLAKGRNRVLMWPGVGWLRVTGLYEYLLVPHPLVSRAQYRTRTLLYCR